MTFKVGDKVKVVSEEEWYDLIERLKIEEDAPEEFTFEQNAIIKSINKNTDMNIYIEFESGDQLSFYPWELKLIKPIGKSLSTYLLQSTA